MQSKCNGLITDERFTAVLSGPTLTSNIFRNGMRHFQIIRPSPPPPVPPPSNILQDGFPVYGQLGPFGTEMKVIGAGSTPIYSRKACIPEENIIFLYMCVQAAIPNGLIFPCESRGVFDFPTCFVINFQPPRRMCKRGWLAAYYLSLAACAAEGGAGGARSRDPDFKIHSSLDRI